MAALLKKRAVAQFSQVIQEEPKPVKKLRLIQRPPQTEVNLDLQGVTSAHEALNRLLALEDRLSDGCNISANVLRELLDHFHHEKEAMVRSKIAQILGKLGKVPQFNKDSLTEDVIMLLNGEKSHKVISSLIQCLHVIGSSVPETFDLHSKILAVCKKHIHDSDHSVRCSCLDLIGSLGSHDHFLGQPGETTRESSQSLLLGFCEDQEPRVRSAAFSAMLKLHQRGLSLPLTVYKQACSALTDDYEDVRLSAVKLIWVLCHRYPESMLPMPSTSSGSQGELRLVDDGFAKICNMVNDISVKVRVEAANLLGSLHHVSPSFLEQTLDKKLMSNMRRKTSAHERARDHYQSGEWSTGQKWADDAPKEELNPEDISLMNIGACGAFVHGTEDEFLEVRNVALDSLCELAAQSSSFANQSQDSIIDMFNDEIESVRQNAINSLRKLSNYITLREDHLEIILGVLQDFSATTRELLRDMLCDMTLATRECLSKCIFGLLDNLRRYPQDRVSIWKCMKHLGRNHPHLTLPLVPELLCLHPYFDTPEPDMDDPAYISVLSLVFNSAASCSTMITMFQDHTWRHYHYLRDSLPDLIPVLRKTTDTVEEKSEKGTRDTDTFLQQCLQKLNSIEKMDLSAAQSMLEVMVRDLEHLSVLDETSGSSAECVCLFLQCQLLLSKLINHDGMHCSSSISDSHVLSSLEKIFSLIQKLEYLFLGLGSEELALVRQTRVKAMTLHLLTKMTSDPTRCNKLKESFIKQLHSLKNFLSTNEIAPDGCAAFLFSVLPELEDGKISEFLKHLQHAVKLITPCSFVLQNNVRKICTVITEPTGTSDNPVKFTAGLTVAIPLDAKLENISSVSQVRVQVKYPDQQTQIIIPPQKDFHKLGPLRHRLLSQVVLSHSLWSDQSNVEVNLVLEVKDTGVEGETTRVIDLCKPVKVLVAPKPAKR